MTCFSLHSEKADFEGHNSAWIDTLGNDSASLFKPFLEE